jgi:hypothetical protein
VDNVLYVTTKENAKALHKEEQKKRLAAEALAEDERTKGGLQSVPVPLRPEFGRYLNKRDEKIRKLKGLPQKKDQPEPGPLQKEAERLLKEREEQLRKLKESFEKKAAPQPEPKKGP